MTAEIPEETETPHVLTAFIVTVDLDGRVSVVPGSVHGLTTDHEVTLVDIETYCSQLAREAGRLMLVRELTPPPPAPTAAERVAEALRQRSE